MKEFAPYVETKITINYINEHIKKNNNVPFCIFSGWIPPHWSSYDSGRDYGDYPKEYAIYDPEKVDIPGNIPDHLRDFAKKEIADYYGMVTAIDACMGQILGALEKNDLKENTIVCFSSDHGDHLSSHGYIKNKDEKAQTHLGVSKLTPYEEFIHIPFILRYPARVKGSVRTDILFNSVDVLPTLLGLCDVKIPDDVQGKNLSHTVLGGTGEEPDSVYLQILGPGWPTKVKSVGLWRGIRTHQYTYARWKDRGGMRMLFDHKKDPSGNE